jgi:phenylalanyl-tRNA synthetase beta chain
MRVPVSWLREYLTLPETLSAREIGAALIRVGLEVETVYEVGAGRSGPLVVGTVLEFEKVAGTRKPIRWCQVDVGGDEPRGIICGATNFEVGDHVVVALPGAVLPGGFEITARQAYGRTSDGMICSVRELGIGEDHAGILVLSAADLAGAGPGADAAALLQLPDAVLDIALTPDRGYCQSLRGVAREAAHALGGEFTDPAAALVLPDPAQATGGWPVQIDDPVGCDRFSAWTVTGLDPAAPSPLWMRRRLMLAGMRPISLAVDVTNYVMLELGQPMHAFDRAKLTGGILVRRAVPNETLVTLDGVTRRLSADDLLVTDESGPLALAGVMGGASTEIGPDTTDIVLEAAHWDPPTIMRMVRRHRLPSEAARRFERGVDPEVALPALRRAAGLLAEFGGAADGGLSVVGPARPRPHIALAADRPGRIAGRDIPLAAVVARLVEIGCEVEGEYTLAVVPPSWRPDLVDPADLVEEVIRLEGYDAVSGVLPAAPAGRGLTSRQRLHRSIGRALAESGYVEVLSYPFVSPRRADDLGLGADDPARHAVRVANPLSDEQPLLRTSLLPGLLDTLARNLSRGMRDVALFETGLVYLPRPDAAPAPQLGVDRRPTDAELAALERALPEQPRHVAVALAGDRVPPGWWGDGESAGWPDAVEAARLVVRAAGAEPTSRAARVAPWHPGRCAEILVGERVVGHAGELHPRVLAALGLPARTAAMELDLDALPDPEPVRGPALSTFPPALLDVALVVAERVPAADVEAALREGAGELLESVRLFDRYADPDRLGEGRKSLAYALRFRAPDRTLTVEEANAAKQAAVAEAASRTGAVLR